MILLVNFDGTPYAVKVARTVWSGGKSGDCIKGLPIAIIRRMRRKRTKSFKDKVSGHVLSFRRSFSARKWVDSGIESGRKKSLWNF